ncbi:MAG: FadR family transcriptional regulator [Lachnospiraceae bacterium]|nr:FadR family transcriptional regulator [Lachnospiraceae bacterium]
MSATISQQTLPQKAADAIIRLIRTQNYAAGTKLPNEYELSRMLNVSRNTVREAIKLLVSRNILEVRRGAGTFVSDKQGLGDDPLGLSMIVDQPRLYRDLMQVRLLTEPKCAAFAAQYATPEDIGKLQLLVSEPEDLLHNNTLNTVNDAAFHLHISHCSGNMVLYNINTAIYNRLTQQDAPIAVSGKKQLLTDHLRIFQAIRRHDSCGAYDAMLAHLMHHQEQLPEDGFPLSDQMD